MQVLRATALNRAERKISGVANPWKVQLNLSKAGPSWYVRDRWGLVPTITGILIVAFVAATRGEYAAWLLWIAIPMLMIGLGYFVVVNAVRYFMF